MGADTAGATPGLGDSGDHTPMAAAVFLITGGRSWKQWPSLGWPRTGLLAAIGSIAHCWQGKHSLEPGQARETPMWGGIYTDGESSESVSCPGIQCALS